MKKWKKAYATSTCDLIRKYESEKNPVTKSVYRQILGNRIDRLEMFRLEVKEELA